MTMHLTKRLSMELLCRSASVLCGRGDGRRAPAAGVAGEGGTRTERDLPRHAAPSEAALTCPGVADIMKIWTRRGYAPTRDKPKRRSEKQNCAHPFRAGDFRKM